MNQCRYYLIVNAGTMIASPWVASYPRHLVLAQMYAAGSKAYRERLAALIAYRADVILDNGAHEGVDFDTEAYGAIIKDLTPRMFVLPDLVGRPSIQSRDLSLSFAKRMREEGVRGRMMFAAQGRNETEILKAYEWALINLDPGEYTIGLGQSYLPFERRHRTSREAVSMRIDEEARAALITQVLRMPGANVAAFHILGARWRPINWSYWFDHFNFTGLDTVKPCACAVGDTVYPSAPHGAKMPLMSEAVAHSGALAYNVRRVQSYYGLAED